MTSKDNQVVKSVLSLMDLSESEQELLENTFELIFSNGKAEGLREGRRIISKQLVEEK